MTPLLMLRSRIETAIDNIERYLSDITSPNVLYMAQAKHETICLQLRASLTSYRWVLEEINSLLGEKVNEPKKVQ
jgi:hypothetical protein